MKNLLPNKIAQIIILCALFLSIIFNFVIDLEFPLVLSKISESGDVIVYDIILFGIIPLILFIVSAVLMFMPFKKPNNIFASLILFNVGLLFMSFIGVFSSAVLESSFDARILLLILCGVVPVVVAFILAILFVVFYNKMMKGKFVNSSLLYTLGSLATFFYLVGFILNYMFIKTEVIVGSTINMPGTCASPILCILFGVFQIPVFVTLMLHKFDKDEVWIPSRLKPHPEVNDTPVQELPGDVQIVYVQHENTSPRRRTTTIMLCFFLGALGAHRFYTGKILTGILYIFTFGGFFFGSFCDLLMLLFGMYRDKEGRTVRDEF